MDGTRMSAQDALWLTMDRPNNLMVIDVAVVLDGCALAGCAPLGLPLPRHVAIRSSAGRPFAGAPRGGGSMTPSSTSIAHVTAVAMPPGSGMPDVQRHVAAARSVPFDRAHPLWSAEVLAPVRLDDGTVGSVHRHPLPSRDRRRGAPHPGHARNAGPRLRVDRAEGGAFRHEWGSAAVDGRHRRVGRRGRPRHGGHHPARPRGSSPVRRRARWARWVSWSRPRRRQLPPRLRLSARRSGWCGTRTASSMRLQVLGVDDHRSVNDMTSAGKLLLGGSSRTVWTGRPGDVKSVAWSPPIDLSRRSRRPRARVAQP